MNVKSPVQLELKCGFCNAVFYLSPKVYRQRMQRAKSGKAYCSRSCGTKGACAAGYRAKPPRLWVWITCVMCGEEKRRRAAEYRLQRIRSRSGFTFCSQSCATSFTSRKEIREAYRRMKLPAPENKVASQQGAVYYT